MGRRTFGSVRKLPSGKYQARYTGPDGQVYSARTEGGWTTTFTNRGLANAALAAEQTAIQKGTWTPPRKPGDVAEGPVLLREYADSWLETRTLEESTRAHYRKLLDRHIYPGLGDLAVKDIEPARVRTWQGKVAKGHPTTKAHAYSLLKTILGAAVEDRTLPANPCMVRGASTSKRARKIRPAEMDELEIIIGKLPERYRLMVLLACWCSLRFGELAELRRGDVDMRHGLLRVRRGVARTKGQRHVKGPKSEAGKRDVHVPEQIMPAVKDHLRDHVNLGGNALLFPAAGDPTKHLAPSTLQAVFYPAREAAARPDLRFHDLRHTGATLAAQAGATLADLMARLGHSTPRAAMIYQHTAASRDKRLATEMYRLATVTNIDTARKEGTA